MWEIRRDTSHAVPVCIGNAKALSWDAMGNKPTPLLCEDHITAIAESGHASIRATHPCQYRHHHTSRTDDKCGCSK